MTFRPTNSGAGQPAPRPRCSPSGMGPTASPPSRHQTPHPPSITRQSRPTALLWGNDVQPSSHPPPGDSTLSPSALIGSRRTPPTDIPRSSPDRRPPSRLEPAAKSALHLWTGPRFRARALGPSHPSRRQQDLRGGGRRRGRGRRRSLVGLVALDAGHGGLEADLHHGCDRPRVRPAASAGAGSLRATAAPRSARTGSLAAAQVAFSSPTPSSPRPRPLQESLGALLAGAPSPPSGRAVTPAGRALRPGED